ncbi:hypothetical protein G9A89_007637 [Geosiphon pyriformis]|nr:hypothetical protein G9A89_007637 [Geosiphon pyriformis]
MSLKLKIRQANNGKVYEIVSSPEDKVSTLESSIQKYTGIEARRQELKMGYPPRKISSKETETLHAAGIRNGETIIVHEIPWDKVLEIEARRRKQQKESSISVDTDYGHIILREMPDDNSCLFRAIG